MISTKGRYAIRLMIDLAENNTGSPIPLDAIATRQDISKKYLESIVKLLVTVACLEDGAEECPHASKCKTLSMWKGYDKLTYAYFSKITINDLLSNTKKY